jgi:hypothetical protein
MSASVHMTMHNLIIICLTTVKMLINGTRRLNERVEKKMKDIHIYDSTNVGFVYIYKWNRCIIQTKWNVHTHTHTRTHVEVEKNNS